MVIHTALFKWKKEIAKQDIAKAMNDVMLLKEKIPAIIEIYAGENFSKYSEGFTHAVIVKFKNRQKLDEYRSHPAHEPIAEKIEQMEVSSIGVDFEV
jgi:hypothetical protein